MSGPEQRRVAEVIVERGGRYQARRGSGYRVTAGSVLTAGHVVAGADQVWVRFSSDLPGEWTVPAQVAIEDPVSDVAVLRIDSPGPTSDITPALFGRLGYRAAPLEVSAVGFPRFKLREDRPGGRDSPPSQYRDSHQVTGTVSPLSNWREGSLEIVVPPPAPDPDVGHSPWEGMSGAAVWCKGRIVGVISKHHPRDGLGALAAARIDHLYSGSVRGAFAALCGPAGLSAEQDELIDVTDPFYPGVMDCPYRGLESFSEEHARYFFGRGQVVAQLLDTLATEPFVALAGASGSGKSSVLSAGLIPAAAAGEYGTGYHCQRITPTADPLRELAQAIAAWSGTDHASTEDDAAQIEQQIQDALVGNVSRQPLLLVVDQMEELFALCPDEKARRAFIRALLALISGPDPQNRIAVGVRSDCYVRCLEDRDLGPFMDHRHILRPMVKAELRSVIEEPAALAGLHIDPGLTEMLLTDVGDEPGKLPLLSHALLATFERRTGPQLTIADYIAAGRVQGAVNKSANEAFESLGKKEQTVAQAIFLRCTAGDADGPDTRRPVRRVDLDPETFPGIGPVLEHLAAARLITLTTRQAGHRAEFLAETAEEQIIEVVHEELIRSWGRLTGWLDDYRPYQAVHQNLISAAWKWEQAGRAPAWLYQGADLDEARKLPADDPRTRLIPRERVFLSASRAQTRFRE